MRESEFGVDRPLSISVFAAWGSYWGIAPSVDEDRGESVNSRCIFAFTIFLLVVICCERVADLFNTRCGLVDFQATQHSYSRSAIRECALLASVNGGRKNDAFYGAASNAHINDTVFAAADDKGPWRFMASAVQPR